MIEREPLLQTILEHPEADWPRLVYADWLEERGETAHAELIRVQCELAHRACRGEWRKTLRKRERELLRRPEFRVCREQVIRIGPRKTILRQVGKFTRGLIEQFIAGGRFPLTPELNLPWDKVLSVRLSIGSPIEPELLAEILRQPWASRITAVDFWEVPVTEAVLRQLAACKALTNLHSFLAFGCRVHLRGFADLVASPVVRRWNVLQVVGDFTGPRNRVITEVDSPAMVEALRRIGNTPAVADLKFFGLGVRQIVGPACVQTLLDAPHLTDKIDRFIVTLDSSLPGGLRADLRRKFPRSWKRQ